MIKIGKCSELAHLSTFAKGNKHLKYVGSCKKKTPMTESPIYWFYAHPNWHKL